MDSNSVFRRAFLGTVAGLVAAAALTSSSPAQEFPTQPIKIIVGFAPGGVTDAIPRLLAEPMSKRLGQPVIVENKPGAGGAIAIAAVAGAPPDGHTLLAGGVGIVVLPHTSKDLPVNPVTELAHISMTGEGDQWITINPAVPANNYAEFVSYVKKNPGKLFYGDAGAGSNMNLFIEYFKMLAGIDMPAVHYKGGGHIRLDLIANRVQMSLNALPTIKGFLDEGKLRPILLIGKERHPDYPHVPTVAEAGLKQLEVASNWFSLHAPKGTPQSIIEKIYTAMADSLKTEGVKTGLTSLDIRAVGDTPKEFSARVAKDYETFGEIVRKAGIEKQ